MKRISKKLIKKGMRVTPIERVAAYYSRTVFLEPGEVATVLGVDCPCVTYAYRTNGGTATFVCVEFERNGPQKAALYYNNIRLVTESPVVPKL